MIQAIIQKNNTIFFHKKKPQPTLIEDDDVKQNSYRALLHFSNNRFISQEAINAFYVHVWSASP